MSITTKTLTAGALALAMIAAPAASFAQTSGTAQSTGDRENAKERAEVDKTRSEQVTPTTGGSTGSTSGYTESNPAPPPNAAENQGSNKPQ